MERNLNDRHKTIASGNNPMKNPRQDLVDSFTNAIRGLFHALATQRNLRVHFAIGMCVILGGVFFKLPFLDFLLLVFVVSLVIITELINTVVEMFIDALFDQYNIIARRIKDVSASAVLVAATTSIIIGYLILFKHFPPSFRNAFDNLASSPWYFTFVVSLLILFIYLGVKFFFRKQALISGGMPSIHSGLAFSIWVIVSVLTFRVEPLVSFLVFLLAVWVAQGRVIKRIHTVGETVIGAVFGILLTVLFFQILEKMAHR